MATRYSIHVDKDRGKVKAVYDVWVTDMASDEFISSFVLSVDGTALVTDLVPPVNNKRHFGTRHHVLKDPGKDAPVSFSISNTRGWSTSGTDTLRGTRNYDDVYFSN